MCEENRDIDEHQDYRCANYAQGKTKLVLHGCNLCITF